MKIICFLKINQLALTAICAVFLAFSTFAGDKNKKSQKIVGRILKVHGNAFLFNQKETKSINSGDVIYDLSELMVEDQGQVNFQDTNKNIYFLSAGAHIKFLNQMIELKNGFIWVKALNATQDKSIHTSNAQVNYTMAEFIYHFDNSLGKTQVIVLNEEVEFNNFFEPDLKFIVPMGKFSFIDPKYNNSTPRAPVSIGKESFALITGQFSEVKPTEKGMIDYLKNNLNEKDIQQLKASDQMRGIASVNTHDQKSTVDKTDGIIIIKNSVNNKHGDAKEKDSAFYYYERINAEQSHLDTQTIKKKNNNKDHQFMKKGKVVFYEKKKNNQEDRGPASIAPSNATANESMSVNPVIKNKKSKVISDLENAFEKSLKNKKLQKKRHPSSVNKLINELESIKTDYREDY